MAAAVVDADGHWTLVSAIADGSAIVPQAHAVNDAGTVVGGTLPGLSSFVECAFMWTVDEGSHCIDRPPQDLGSTASDINNDGTIVGHKSTFAADGISITDRAWILAPGDQAVALLPLGPDDTWSRANAINDRGDIVGASGTGQPTDLNGRAVLWRAPDYQPVELEVAGAVASVAFGINARGMIVGGRWAADGTVQTVVWNRRLEPRLLTAGFAADIADDGAPVGFVLRDNRQLAARFDPHTFQAEVLDPGGRESRAVAAAGTHIVGLFRPPDSNVTHVARFTSSESG